MEKKTEPEKKIIPFKLCFATKHMVGRSNIQIGKPLKLPATITPKFYGRYDVEHNYAEAVLKKKLEYLNVKGPKEKYEDPITENQRYGWYHDVQLTDLDRNDPRLYFGKRPNPIVKEHLMNYAKIR